jgi:hypothetical protein
MSSATVLGGEVSDRAGWSTELVVVRDRRGQGKAPVRDPGTQRVKGPGAVAFEGEDVFVGSEMSDKRCATEPANKCRNCLAATRANR